MALWRLGNTRSYSRDVLFFILARTPSQSLVHSQDEATWAILHCKISFAGPGRQACEAIQPYSRESTWLQMKAIDLSLILQAGGHHFEVRKTRLELGFEAKVF
ncbi:hypothetical protein N7486_005401 [Penicillium sp. IBT 16267x]|nr:hypothetical protein N7486_005401 [Penicillium sp. IBT 16267x]